MTYTKIKTSRELGKQLVPNLPDWVKETNALKDDIVTVQTNVDTVQSNLTAEIATYTAGSTALATGALTGGVSHGLASTPVAVILTPTNTGALWVTNVGSSSFVVNRETGPGPITVYYRAEI